MDENEVTKFNDICANNGHYYPQVLNLSHICRSIYKFMYNIELEPTFFL